jgi:hypothetical protein
MLFDPLFVRVGQAITEKLWNALLARVAAVRLLPGPGIRLQYTENGTIVSAIDTGRGGAPVHHFRVTLAGDRLTIRPGLVNGIEPKIGTTPLSGDKKTPQPSLDFRSPKLDGERRGYVALEIQCGPDWQITNVQAVQVAAWETEDGKPAEQGSGQPSAISGVPGLLNRRVRYPLALIQPDQAGNLEVVQIVHFHLRHHVKPRDLASNVARHFFSIGGVA